MGVTGYNPLVGSSSNEADTLGNLGKSGTIYPRGTPNRLPPDSTSQVHVLDINMLYINLALPVRRRLTQKQIANFEKKLDKTPGYGRNGDCWIWTAARRGPYGHLHVNYEYIYAHRLAYELAYGPLPDVEGVTSHGVVVRHDCDEPLCCNPRHLFVGTQRDNVQDRVKRGRGACGPAFSAVRRLAWRAKKQRQADMVNS